MPYDIEFRPSALQELKKLRAFDQRKVVDSVEEQLTHDPTKETTNRKPLPNVRAEFEHVPPIWEIRVGEFRVFYDVNQESKRVNICAIRRKGKQTTEEIT